MGDRRGMDEKENRSHSRKCTLLQSLFGGKESKLCSQKQHQQQGNESKRENSEKSSFFGSKNSRLRRKEKVTFSRRINFAVIQDLIDIQLQSDITAIVHPLTHE